ncbi:MAG: zinc-dependent metalloprotease, partial [Candidatus Eremiobacteraeota bacterium]|nr:zinc-dependent metalloprotease [Candidatus Eremiobacteraeota bacterium]
HWGYARIPGARTPQDELPTLHRWASQWSNPMYRFASDEDASWADGHAIDPRNNQWDLTNDTLGWCAAQMNIHHRLFSNLDRRFPRYGEDYESERQAFGAVLRQNARCALMTEHYIGGQYLSRAHYGDPKSGPPLKAVSRADERRAWQMLDQYLFSDNAWRFSPNTLNRLTYSEYSPFNGASWNYSPPPRHDVPVVDIIGQYQTIALDRMFQPLMLQRLRDFALTTTPGETMSLTDLFDWAQSSIYGDLTSKNLRSIPVIHRNLQQSYARLLLRLVNGPPAGTPFDASSLARAKLVALGADLQRAQHGQLDELTRAHLADLQRRISQGLDAHAVINTSRLPATP